MKILHVLHGREFERSITLALEPTDHQPTEARLFRLRTTCCGKSRARSFSAERNLSERMWGSVGIGLVTARVRACRRAGAFSITIGWPRRPRDDRTHQPAARRAANAGAERDRRLES